jgi:transposase InsO family protein
LSASNVRLFISVNILGKDFPAMLDTGSSVSIIGDDVISQVQSVGVKCKKLSKEIRFLKGTCHSDRMVTVNVDFEHGKKRQSFLLVPGALKTVLLGRDFIGPAQIGINIGLEGWTVGKNKEIYPFIPTPDCFLLSSDYSESDLIPISKRIDDKNDTISPSAPNEDDIETESFEYMNSEPAQILANWENFPDLKDPDVEIIPQVQLAPTAESNIFLEAPAGLHEDARGKLALVMNKFTSIFTKRPGLCSLYKHQINTGDHSPLKSNLRPMNVAKRQIFDQYFFELIKYDVIERSQSSWSSSAFLVPKQDGSMRFVVDYKPLNSITIPDVYPMSRMDDMLAILCQCQYFSTFDLAKGFFQIEVVPEHRDKTAFISHHGLWHFKRLPMGLSNSPATFVRCIDHVLGDLKWKICAVYFDDIIVFSSTFEEHLLHLEMVLTRIKEAGLTINPSKVQLCRQKLKFLGHVIEPGKCLPNPEKVEVVRNYPVPISALHIQKFLGLVGFYLKFIPDFATHAKPLYTLIKKGVKFAWNSEAQNGFDELRNSLTSLTEVYLPDLNLPFIIQCDASDSGLGAVLVQEKDGRRYPIWFASRSLKSAETRYSVSEKECLSVLWAIEKFRGYVEYSHFIIETDHQALSWLRKLKEPAGRLARWFLTLQMYDFEVRYKPGDSVNMRGADALSRLPAILHMEECGSVSRFDIIEEQEKDDELSKLVQFLRGIYSPLSFREKEHLKLEGERSFISEDGLLMRYVGPKSRPWEDEALFWRIWVPKSLRSKLIFAFHNTLISGHMGIRKTFHRLEERFYWKNMRRDVSSFVNRCAKCQVSKIVRIPPAPASSFNADSPWEVITVDLMGPYPPGTYQSTFLLVVVDMFTKYVELFPLRKAKTEAVTDMLWQVCCRWGVPKVILSDNGTQFTSGHYSDWCRAPGIKPFYISAYHPQANLTERYNQTIKTMIVSTIEKCKHWDRHLPELAFALRTAQNDSTQFSPDYLNTGRIFRTPFDTQIDISLPSSKDVQDIGKRINMIQSIARDNIQQSKEVYLANYNKKAKERLISVGDKVLLKSHFLSDSSKGFSSKLAPRREGPFLVTKKISENIFELQSIESGQVVRKVHINELVPFLDAVDQDAAPKAICPVQAKSASPTTSVLLSDVLSGTDELVPVSASFSRE